MPLGRQALSAWAYQKGPGQYYQPAYHNIASAIAVESGAFLDLGCGPGWLAIHVAAGKPELDAIGIDTSPEMLKYAELNKGPRLNVTFREMAGSEIVYPEGTFTAAAAVQSAHHWEHTEAILAEVHRVLAPASRFYIYEADPDTNPVPDGWIKRNGPWPPDALIKQNWKRFGMGASAWEELKAAVRQSPFGGGEDGRHGFYRRLVLTR